MDCSPGVSVLIVHTDFMDTVSKEESSAEERVDPVCSNLQSVLGHSEGSLHLGGGLDQRDLRGGEGSGLISMANDSVKDNLTADARYLGTEGVIQTKL